MILIYDDGVQNNSHLMRALNKIFPTKTVRFCGAWDIQNDILNGIKLLIMPGGADLYFCEKLNGACNTKIRDFVAAGGSYLGLCAGAYYACASLNWNHGEIDGARELALYEGHATGPIHDFIEDTDNIYDTSWINAALITTKTESFMALYNGGPIFTEPTDKNATVIARYHDLNGAPPAIISGVYGKGRYTLSSPHIEKFGHLLWDGLYRHLNKSYEHNKKVMTTLSPYENKQNQFFKTIIEELS